MYTATYRTLVMTLRASLTPEECKGCQTSTNLCMCARYLLLLLLLLLLIGLVASVSQVMRLPSGSKMSSWLRWRTSSKQLWPKSARTSCRKWMVCLTVGYRDSMSLLTLSVIVRVCNQRAILQRTAMASSIAKSLNALCGRIHLSKHRTK
jgi:hypothetical protein